MNLFPSTCFSGTQTPHYSVSISFVASLTGTQVLWRNGKDSVKNHYKNMTFQLESGLMEDSNDMVMKSWGSWRRSMFLLILSELRVLLCVLLMMQEDCSMQKKEVDGCWTWLKHWTDRHRKRRFLEILFWLSRFLSDSQLVVAASDLRVRNVWVVTWFTSCLSV